MDFVKSFLPSTAKHSGGTVQGRKVSERFKYLDAASLRPLKVVIDINNILPCDPDEITGFRGSIDPEKLDELGAKLNRKMRKSGCRSFSRSCTLDCAFKTYIRSGFATGWTDKSYGFSWVSVLSMDESVCVVARHADLDTARLGHKTRTKDILMEALGQAIVSEVEGMPFDGNLRKKLGLSIKKPFGVVCVCPDVGNSRDEEAKRDDAITFLMEKMNESVITLDDAIKTAISAFKCLCSQELRAEEYSVTVLDWVDSDAYCYTVPMIEKHLARINIGSATANKKIDEQFDERGLTVMRSIIGSIMRFIRVHN